MDAQTKRRETILEIITNSETPISATKIAGIVGVSRQVVVGDVALLRANRHQIVATARGYVMENTGQMLNLYRRKIACKHTPEETKDELYLLVDLGARIEDVIVEHHVYGELSGSLGISTRKEADNFIESLRRTDVKLLSELTGGVHLHTVTFESKAHYEAVIKAMEKAGFLV